MRPIREEKEKSARVKEKYYKNEDRIREGDSVKNKNNRNMKMNGNANNNVNKNEGKQFRE